MPCDILEFLLDFHKFIGVDLLKLDCNGVDKHFGVLQPIQHGIITVIGELVHQNIIAVLLEAINPTDDALVVGLDNVQTVLCCSHDTPVCHVMFVEIQVGNGQVVVGKGHFIPNLVKIGHCVRKELLFVVDCGTVVQDNVTIWASMNLKQFDVNFKKSLLYMDVSLTVSVLFFFFKSFLQHVSPPKVKGQHLRILKHKARSILALDKLDHLPSLEICWVCLSLVDGMKFHTAACHGYSAVSNIHIFRLLLEIEVFLDKFQKLLKVFHSLSVILLIK